MCIDLYIFGCELSMKQECGQRVGWDGVAYSGSVDVHARAVSGVEEKIEEEESLYEMKIKLKISLSRWWWYTSAETSELKY